MTELSSGYFGLARSFAAPDDSREHRSLRKDLLEWGLLGSDGVYRYCFSKLSGKNGFAMDPTELRDEVRTFLSRELPKPSMALCIDGIQWDLFVAPYLRNRLHVVETGEALPKRSKEDRAIDAVLLDPTLTDDDVRELLKTTEKQMRRWSTYGILRRALTRNAMA
jgi:hypothetical protein